MYKLITIMMIVVSGIVIIAAPVSSEDKFWDMDYMRMQKNSLFGPSFNAGYQRWFGFRGSGFGLSTGYAGIVAGMKKDIKPLELPDIFDKITEDASGNKIRMPTYIEIGEIYIDAFTYVNLPSFSEAPWDISRWLFWELNIWFGLR